MAPNLPFLLHESFSCFSLLGLKVIHGITQRLQQMRKRKEKKKRPNPKQINICKLFVDGVGVPFIPCNYVFQSPSM